MISSDYAAKKKYHDLIGNSHFYFWCRTQGKNVDYEKIIFAYEKIEYPRRRPRDFESKLKVKVNEIYVRINKYMVLAEQYEREQNAKDSG